MHGVSKQTSRNNTHKFERCAQCYSKVLRFTATNLAGVSDQVWQKCVQPSPNYYIPDQGRGTFLRARARVRSSMYTRNKTDASILVF